MSRFADYFVVCGVGKQLKPLIKEKKGDSGNPFQTPFQSQILERFPSSNWSDGSLPNHIWMFCFPSGLQLKNDAQPPSFFIFALTEVDGTRFYGAALTYFEPISSEVISNYALEYPQFAHSLKKSIVYAPTCICLISHFPFFSLFRKYLREIYSKFRPSDSSNSQIPIERIVEHIICDIPLPPKGGIKLQLTIGNHQHFCSRPADNQFEVAEFSLGYLFESLGISNVVRLIGNVLIENKVVFVSSQYTLLTIACETLCTLLFPFKWHHVYVPILGCTLSDFLQAPTPFIMGIHKSYYKWRCEMEGVVIADLDEGTLSGSEKNLLPREEEQKLIRGLKKILCPQLQELDVAFPKGESEPERRRERNVDLEIRVLFLEMFISIFENYKKYINYIREIPRKIAIFKSENFMKDNPRFVPFFSRFVETQAFSVFLEKHSEHLLFDDSIKAKKNGQDLYYLENNRSTIVETKDIPPPNSNGLPSDQTYDYQTMRYPIIRAEYLTRPVTEINAVAPLSAPPVLVARPNQLSHSSIERDEAEEEERESNVVNEKDSVAKEFMRKCLSKIFQESKLHSDENNLIRELFKLESGRTIFALLLVEFKEKTAKPCVSDGIFNIITELMTRVLEESQNKVDFVTPRILMNLASSFYHLVNGIPEFVHHKVQDLEIWKNDHFWEAAFFDSVIEGRKKTPNQEEEEVKEEEEREEGVVFSALGAISYNMLNLGVPSNNARHFIARMSSLTMLKDDHIQTLLALLKNMERVNNMSETPAENLKSSKAKVEERKRTHLGSDYYSSSLSKSEEDEKAETKELFAKLIEATQNIEEKIPSLVISSPTGTPKKASTSSFSSEDSVVTEEGEKVGFRTLSGHKGGIECVEINGDVIVSGSSDGGICVWNISNGKLIRKLIGHKERISCIDLDETNIVSASYDCTVKVWDASEGSCIYTMTGHTASVTCLQLQGTSVVSGSADQSLQIFDTRMGKYTGTLQGHNDSVTCVQFEESLNTIVSGSRDTSVKIWDLRMFRCLHTLSDHTDWIKSIRFDSQRIISSSYDCTLKLWDLKSASFKRTFTGHKGCINAFQYDGDRLISGSGDHEIKLWNIETGDCLKTYKGHSDEVMSLELVEETIISGSNDHTIKMWNINNEQCKRTLTGHNDWVYTLKTDGKNIVSGSWDATVKVWGVESLIPRKIKVGRSESTPAIPIPVPMVEKSTTTFLSSSPVPIHIGMTSPTARRSTSIFDKLFSSSDKDKT